MISEVYSCVYCTKWNTGRFGLNANLQIRTGKMDAAIFPKEEIEVKAHIRITEFRRYLLFWLSCITMYYSIIFEN